MAGVVSASMKDAAKVFESGKWSVLRDIDKMTDKVSCTGVYGSDYGKQLTTDTLYIGISGGISSVTMRFDESPALPFRLGTKLEKEIRSLMLKSDEFQTALTAKRLRMQVGTLVSGIQDFDIDLTGLSDALDNIKQGCPMPALTSAPILAPTLKTEPISTCNTELISKMQKAGITKNQLLQVCGLK